MGSRIDKFEDLIAWQKARQLRLVIGRLTRTASFRRDASLADQMRRAARSVMANIAEGFDKHSRPEFHRFLTMAKGSCGEVKSDLYVAFDDELIDQATFDELRRMCEEESRILAGLQASLRRTQSAPVPRVTPSRTSA